MDDDPPLLQAARIHNDQRLEALLDNDENPDQRGNHGYTALHWAAFNDCCRSTELLIRRGATVDLQNDYGDTPLHVAARRGRSRVARLLIRNGRANCNMRDDFGTTPLHYAAERGHVQVAQVLLLETGGAAVDEENISGQTPLCVAAEYRKWDVMQVLVRHHNASVPRAFQRLVSTEGFLHWIEDDRHQRSILSLTTDAADIIAKNCWRGMVQLLRYHYHGTNRNRLRPPPVLEDLPSDEEVFLQKHRWMIHPLVSLLHNGSGRVLKHLFKVYDRAGLVLEECSLTRRIPLWTALETWSPQPEVGDEQEQPQPEGWNQHELERATEGLQILLDAASEQLRHRNNERVSPFLYALENRLPARIISKMVDLWPEACGVTHPLNQRIPLAFAIEAHMPWQILDKTIKAYPKSVAMKDVAGGLSMWQLAASRDCGVTEIYMLLRECPHTVASAVVRTGKRKRSV